MSFQEDRLILGLDQATHTGWAISDLSGKIVAQGTKVFTGTTADKHLQLEQWLAAQIQDIRPVIIAYEKPHFRGYSSTLLCVGCVAVIEMMSRKFNIPVMAVATQTLKKFATGSAKAEKKQMTEAASQVIGKSLRTKQDNDAADAIHIARWAAQQHQNTDK